MRLPHVGQAGRLKPPGGSPVIVAILNPTNKQTKEKEYDARKFRLKRKTTEPAPIRTYWSPIFLFIRLHRET
jgi:hypothetical protein